MILNFQKRFVAKILQKVKRHTVRAKRKIQPHVGEICHCYTGLRQKGAKLLGRWPCVRVQDIEIHWSPRYWISVDGAPLMYDECEALARQDGFATFAEMIAFWEARLPFHGDIIHWDPTRPAPAPSMRRGGRKRVAPNKKESA